MRRTLAPRSTVPSVTRQPATLPTFVMLKISRISALPSMVSRSSGVSRPDIAALHVVDEVVDDVVVADLDAVALGDVAGLLVGIGR